MFKARTALIRWLPDQLPMPPFATRIARGVWRKYLRQNQVANRVYESYDAIVDACCKA
jgi:hypothetical protein